MKELDWDVETDSFTELNTVVGQMDTDNEVCSDKFYTDSEAYKGHLVIGTITITRP